ncbi:MAG TPA: cysteine desulfurase-like protein [Chloroflexota bacterium]|nr:cysteine desulfurase-like protein [Chloroflexota bacterium]
MLDSGAVRAHFPSLQRQENGRPVIYFDNPAGTQVPVETSRGYLWYLENANANEGGLFHTSRTTDRVIAEARAAMADFLDAASPEEIVFGANMTTLAFHLAHGIGRTLQPGDRIVTTRLEHDANVSPWLALCERGIAVDFIDIDTDDMTLDMESAASVIRRGTRLVAAGYASNAFGTINDVRRLGEIAHAAGALFFVDAVHYGPHGPISVRDIGADLLAVSPYKFFGPHLGVLYGRSDVLASIPVDHVRPAGDTPPHSWETGTQSHEALKALLGALSYLESLGEGEDRRTRLRSAMTRIKSHERVLAERLIGGLAAIPGVRIYGISAPGRFGERVPTVSITMTGLMPAEVAARLGERAIYTWNGNHYAVEPMRRLGVPETLRIGLVHYNTPEEIDRFLDALREIVG